MRPSRLLSPIGPALALALASTAVLQAAPEDPSVTPARGSDETVEWDRRAVQHLWNRAGFGVRATDIDLWVEAGQEALVDHLFAPRPIADQAIAPRFVAREPRLSAERVKELSRERRRELIRERNRTRRNQFVALRDDWVQRMIVGEDPLRDRMTLFWHGVFTSSYATVKRTDAIVAQHDTLRDGALGSYADLLRAMLRDPAMLVYLDNDENRKGRPNENLAREVMELFSLGEGNYTEVDVKEAARALTGAGVKGTVTGASYRFERKHHDGGDKTILGVSGDLGPDDLADILLDQPACATYIARSIIEYLEGVPADDARVERYAQGLRETGYDVGFMVRKLFLDPAFYRDDVVGARVASPIDYVVGTATRLDLDLPPRFVVDASASLGQDLFQPPNVKGWDEGMAWITTSTFMMRGNVAGAMLGIVDPEAMRADALNLMLDLAESGDMDGMTAKEMRSVGKQQLRRDEVAKLAGLLKRQDYEPNAYLTRTLMNARTRTDAEAVAVLTDVLLAIEPPPETVRMLTRQLRELRETFDIDEADLARSHGRCERVLRRLGHLVLSLPEAQLH